MAARGVSPRSARLGDTHAHSDPHDRSRRCCSLTEDAQIAEDTDLTATATLSTPHELGAPHDLVPNHGRATEVRISDDARSAAPPRAPLRPVAPVSVADDGRDEAGLLEGLDDQCPVLRAPGLDAQLQDDLADLQPLPVAGVEHLDDVGADLRE